MRIDGVYYFDKRMCSLVCLGVVSNVLDSCSVKLDVVPATRTRRYGRDGSMIQVLGAQNLSVLELNEIELASGIESMFGSDTMCRSCGVVLSLIVVRIVCAMFRIVALAGVIWRLMVMR